MKTQQVSPAGDDHDDAGAAATADHHHHRYQKIEGKLKPSPVVGFAGGTTTVMTVKNISSSNNNINNNNHNINMNNLNAQDLEQFEIQLEQQELDRVPSPPSNPSSPGRPSLSPSGGRNWNDHDGIDDDDDDDDDDEERLDFSDPNSSSLYAPPVMAMGPSISAPAVPPTAVGSASSIALRRQNTPQSPSSPAKKIAQVSVQRFPTTKTSASALTTSSSPPSSSSSSSQMLKNLPPLFLYIEAGDFNRAAERAKRHIREVKAWVSINANNPQKKTKRLALHQACFKVNEVCFSLSLSLCVCVCLCACVLAGVLRKTDLVQFNYEY